MDNFKEFLSIDNNLFCYAENVSEFDSVDEIVEHVAKKKCIEEKEEDEDENPPSPVSTREARSCLERLRLFFMQEGNEESPIALLDIRSDFVQQQNWKNMKQETIEELFFKK